jgi:hypothetical protein
MGKVDWKDGEMVGQSAEGQMDGETKGGRKDGRSNGLTEGRREGKREQREGGRDLEDVERWGERCLAAPPFPSQQPSDSEVASRVRAGDTAAAARHGLHAAAALALRPRHRSSCTLRPPRRSGTGDHAAALRRALDAAASSNASNAAPSWTLPVRTLPQ